MNESNNTPDHLPDTGKVCDGVETGPLTKQQLANPTVIAARLEYWKRIHTETVIERDALKADLADMEKEIFKVRAERAALLQECIELRLRHYHALVMLREIALDAESLCQPSKITNKIREFFNKQT